MENAIAKLGNATTPISRSELDEGFLRAFEDTFAGKAFALKITGTANDPWFRAKDVLRGMGYEINNKNVSMALNKIDEDLKKSLQDLGGLSSHTMDNPEIGYHEGKEIYVNEPGLYQLIMMSRLKSAKPFKDFVYRELFPGIRKIVQQRHEMEVRFKDDRIETLLKKLDVSDKNICDLKKQNELIICQNSDLKKQNELALGKLDDANDQLGEMNDKLDVAVEERAPLPEDLSKSERFVLLKRANEKFPYYAIRAQQTSCKTAVRKQQKEYGTIEILLEFDTHPNTKTYYSRIKLALRKRGVRFVRNEISLENSDMSETQLANEMRKIDDSKKEF